MPVIPNRRARAVRARSARPAKEDRAELQQWAVRRWAVAEGRAARRWAASAMGGSAMQGSGGTGGASGAGGSKNAGGSGGQGGSGGSGGGPVVVTKCDSLGSVGTWQNVEPAAFHSPSNMQTIAVAVNPKDQSVFAAASNKTNGGNGSTGIYKSTRLWLDLDGVEHGAREGGPRNRTALGAVARSLRTGQYVRCERLWE